MSVATKRSADPQAARAARAMRARAQDAPQAARVAKPGIVAIARALASGTGAGEAGLRRFAASQQHQTLLTLQRTRGNTAVQRLLHRAPEDGKDAGCPAGTAWNAGKRITPSFPLDKPPAKRSNSDPSTQHSDPPTMTGGAAADCKGKVWRYQLQTVESKGKIQIVYFTESRYPAPTPADDSGALSNVTRGNWKTIDDDLNRNKAGIPDFWSAYRAEDLHEDYHWKVEWQGEMKKELVKAEDEIARLSVGFGKAATASDAETELAPKAKKAFEDAMKRARTAYNALGDDPGDPPFQAQVPAVEALRKRVQEHATKKGW
jgi:hypothetical protein